MSRARFALVCAALLAACAAVQPPEADRANTYILEPVSMAAPRRPKRDVVLEVSAPRARPGFDTPLMAYTQRPNALEYFARNRWADTPARMLAPLLAQALERSGGFSAVVQAPSIAAADLRLDTELVRLQQDFGARPSRILFSLRAQLIDAATRRVLATAEFDETEAATSDDPYGGVTAANRALGRLLERLAEFCARESGG
ncbi:MAG TPA: ABC-type transport auxiliary lipoprotein family protein [Burkholderiales bacterium]|nr:ABC-type transport auxiliary lipoprotein family protein [Burkholderiales bacterium]